MSHFLGPVRPDGRTVTHTSGLDLVPASGPLGGPRFVILHFESVSLSAGATLTVDLGYGTDVALLQTSLSAGIASLREATGSREP